MSGQPTSYSIKPDCSVSVKNYKSIDSLTLKPLNIIHLAEDPLTVFAPNNDAFARVPSNVLADLLENPEELAGRYFKINE